MLSSHRVCDDLRERETKKEVGKKGGKGGEMAGEGTKGRITGN